MSNNLCSFCLSFYLSKSYGVLIHSMTIPTAFANHSWLIVHITSADNGVKNKIGDYTRRIFILELFGKRIDIEICQPRERFISVSVDRILIFAILVNIIDIFIHWIQFAQFHHRSLHGYSNILTFQGITNDIIKNIQTFVQKNLRNVLEK